MPTSKKEKLESLTVMRTALHSEGDEVDVSSKNSSRFEGGIAERLKSTAAPSSSSLLAGKKLIKSTSRSSTDTTASTDSSDASSDDYASSEPMVVPTKKPSSRMEEEKKKEKDAHHPDVVVVVDVPRAVPDRIHAVVDGPLVIIGFGSIGRGVLPLIERHIRLTDRKSLVVIDPCDDFAHILKRHGVRHLRVALTPENYEATLRSLFPAAAVKRKDDHLGGRTAGGGGGGGGGEKHGMIVNVSVDVESMAVMSLAQELGVLYVDTVIEPWPGVYFGSKLSNSERSNYSLRESMREAGRKYRGGTTAVSGCGANPGMVSWLMKEALLLLARDTGLGGGSSASSSSSDDDPDPPPAVVVPETREGWARLAMDLGVKGVHVAERDTQVSNRPKPPGVFVNTWSVDGLLSEGYQPAELGWGTHEKRMPRRGHRHAHGPGHGIWMDRPGGDTRVRSWVPGAGPQLGLLVTHNESLSITDYYTVREGDGGDGSSPPSSSDGAAAGRVVYRPTCHYAYHPCNDCILSLYETNGSGVLPARKHILTAEEIVSGNDDLGVLLYGHARGAMWYGSRLSIDETRRLAPYQNATGMQVTSAVLAAMVWAVENPNAGFVEADEMDHVRCLQIQRPYLGSIECHYTDWTPVKDRINSFSEEEDRDHDDPWQFTNFLAR